MPIIQPVLKGGGSTPTGTKSITANGTHNVASYEYADVQVPTTAPAFYIEKYNNNGTLENRYVINSLTGITSIGIDALAYAFRGVPNTTPVADFSNITSIEANGLYAAFRGQASTSYQSASGVLDLSSVTSVGDYGLYMAVQDAKDITKVDLSSLQTINKQYALDYMAYSTTTGSCGVKSIDLSSLKTVDAIYAMTFMCYQTGLTSVDLSNLEVVKSYASMANAFRQTSLTSLNLGKLKRIETGTNGGTNAGYCMGYLCLNTSSLTSVNLDNLEFIDAQNAFIQAFGYTNITEFNLPSLCAINKHSAFFQACYYNTTISSSSFDSLKYVSGSQPFDYMFRGCTNMQHLYFKALRTNPTGFTIGSPLIDVTGATIHFPKNLDPQGGSTIISSMSGYPNFGGTNTVLAFDQPSTFLLTGANTTVYERNPKYDTATALAWRVQDTGTAPDFVIDWTPFYTSGTTDPQVNDTIYSDSACTVAVTTIDSIA